MPTTKDTASQLEDLTLSSGIDLIPEEILIHILALVPYSTKSLRTLSRVCRRFRLIINPSRPQPFFKRVAVEQFPGAWTVLQILGDAEYDISILDVIADTHDAVLYILYQVESNLSLITNDLEFDSITWQSDFTHGLLTWEIASRLHYSYSLADLNASRLQQLLPPDLHMTVRYTCAKLARCIFVLAAKWNTSLPPRDWFPSVYSMTDSRRSISQLSTALEQSIPHGSRTQGLAILLTHCSNTTAKVSDPVDASAQFADFLLGLNWTDAFGSRLYACKGFQPDMAPETWLCDPKGVGLGWNRAKIFQLQSLIRQMCVVVNDTGKLDLMEFMHTHEPLLTNSPVKSDEDELLSNIHDAVYDRNEANQRMRLGWKRDSDEGRETVYRVHRDIAIMYDWECALDTELLRRDSKLRKGLQSTSETLKQTALAFRTFKMEDMTSGLMRPRRNM